MLLEGFYFLGMGIAGYAGEDISIRIHSKDLLERHISTTGPQDLALLMNCGYDELRDISRP